MNNQGKCGRTRQAEGTPRSCFPFVATILLGMALILAVLLTVTIPVGLAKADSGQEGVEQVTTAWLDPPTGQIEIGEIITVGVRISDVSDLYGAQFTLVFTPGLVTVLDTDLSKVGIQIEHGDCLSPDFVALNQADIGAGTIDYAITQLAPSLPFTGNCTLAEAQFEGVQGGVTSLSFDELILADPDGLPISAVSLDGTLTVITRGVSLEPNLSSDSDPGQTVHYEHTMINTGNVTDTFDLTHSSNLEWMVNHETPVTLGGKQSTTLMVSITVPANAPDGTTDTTVVTATSRSDPTVFDSVSDTTSIQLPLHQVYLPIIVHAVP